MQQQEKDRISGLGYNPFTIFDFDRLGRKIVPAVYAGDRRNSYVTTFKPDVDLEAFAKDCQVVIINVLNITGDIDPVEKYERGNKMIRVYYKRDNVK